MTNFLKSSNSSLFSGSRLLGMVFLLAGLFSILSPQILEVSDETNRSLWTGLAFMLFGFFVTGRSGGTEVNLGEKRYRIYRAFWGMKYGDWMDIPELAAVHCINHTEESSNLPNGISPTLSGKVTDHYVMAVSTDERLVFSLKYNSQGAAMEAAEKLSKALGVPLK